jgi:hypothetical protein
MTGPVAYRHVEDVRAAVEDVRDVGGGKLVAMSFPRRVGGVDRLVGAGCRDGRPCRGWWPASTPASARADHPDPFAGRDRVTDTPTAPAAQYAALAARRTPDAAGPCSPVSTDPDGVRCAPIGAVSSRR